MYWDLRADGPVRWEGGKDFEKGPRAGALVPPGKYTATLTIGGKTSSQTFEVVNDADSHADQAGMEERYRVTEVVLHELSQLDVALNRMDAIHAQVEALRTAAKGAPDRKAIHAAMESLEEQMKVVRGKITSNPDAAESVLRVPDQLHEHLFALDGLLEGADDAPTPAAMDQKKLLDTEYESAIEAFNTFLKTDVESFNRSMASHKLTGVVVGEPLQP
jgi:hypothetical protein